ncbi:myrosinase 1-like isoform X2 [Anoplophora glabripennis]|uniref:myrosinase 1-like isoform X1 n=1 Tax=Anoplophora glabripennis TaxID=217634 RepID=UPI0008753C36|nr:myrosinase 1-like isoform X1 [Anoplophora glabripennis]XP_018568761.1 myrosinase 1-like isoform X2 [Anoplophora glabripennis]
MMRPLIVLSCLLSVSLAWNSNYFPDNFKFGAATAAQQVEGAWDEDGKTETIWDKFVHQNPDRIGDRSSPDIASDSYHKYKEDIALAKAIGLDHYRMSIAWTRILPTGFADKINQAGVAYYKKLFAEMKANGIEPMVTLHHWDLPQSLQDSYGGWLNETITDLFADYARVCFELFKDDVKIWLTINEPKNLCHSGYGTGGGAPGVRGSGVNEYICARNIVLGHAKAYHIYDQEFRAQNNGRVSIVIDTDWYEPNTNSGEDVEAAERVLQFNFGLYGNPVYKGNWPEVIINRVGNRSSLEGLETSRLPAFTDEEIQFIRGTYDFMAVNYYSSNMVEAKPDADIGDPNFDSDISATTYRESSWPTCNGTHIVDTPWGLRSFLNWLKTTYGDIEIVITENGRSDKTGVLEDDHRVTYIQGHLSACLDAIFTDGINLTGYTVWSLIDTWEWSGGVSIAMGLNRVNFSDPERTRTPRKSATWLTEVIKNRCLEDTCS